MGRFVIYFIVLALMYILSGCSTPRPIERVVYKTEIKVIEVPSNLLKPCLVHQPPKETDYLESNIDDKEDLLTNYTILLLGDLKNCNDQLGLIKDFQDHQKQLYGVKQ
jgi:hypothetical protein